MQVGTYPTRNFATLGPSELQPPFTGGYIQCIIHFFLAYQHRAGVRPYTSSYDFAESCVFTKQSPPPILCHRIGYRYSFSRSYRVILPSSFNMILSLALVYSTHPPVSVYSTVLKSLLFLETQFVLGHIIRNSKTRHLLRLS